MPQRSRDRRVPFRPQIMWKFPTARRSGNGKMLTVVKARENNLQNITVDFPLGKMICVTGVSGSGKSTLVNEILYKSLAAALNGARSRPGQCDDSSRAWSGWTRSSASTSRPLAAPRAPTRPPTPVCSAISAPCSANTQDAKTARLRPRPVQLQRQGRPLRSLRGRRHCADRDALSAGYLRPLRCLQGQALQPRNAGSKI